MRLEVDFLHKILLYYNTIRFLRVSQIYWRIWYSLWKPKLDFSASPYRRDQIGTWVDPARRMQSLQFDDKLTFLNVTKSLKKVGWSGSECTKLWLYNQHYFDDLNALNCDQRVVQHHVLINDWLKNNHSERGIGWEPYPTSLRIVNWVKWHLSGNYLSDECLKSLFVQARWLTKIIEWHILGNHLFANGKALIFAGLFFDGDEAENWLATGLKIITRQLDEQILADGGQFERSPMYHSLILEDILDLVNLFSVFPNFSEAVMLGRLNEVASKMLTWLNDMCHPDGEISFFNDSAIGIAPSPKELNNYAQRLNIKRKIQKKIDEELSIVSNFDSGYFRMNCPDASVFIDAAPVGPNFLPGHAHADTLSFEMSLFDDRVLVNGGTSQYQEGFVRLEERATSAHNTVEVNGQNSSEVWKSFRVARRAAPFDLVVNKKNEAIFLSCSHDGYSHLPGKPIHNRSFLFSKKKLIIRDKISGKFKSAIARYNFHPNVEIISTGYNKWIFWSPLLEKKADISVLEGFAKITKSFHSPEFGIRLETKCLTVNFGSLCEIAVEIKWK